MKKFKSSVPYKLNVFIIISCILVQCVSGINIEHRPALECYDKFNRPQKCLPEFENAAYNVQIEATNTCGENGQKEFCDQKQLSNKKSCEMCNYMEHDSRYLTDLHHDNNPTWWQSETMYEGIQFPNQVNLTLHLGKSFDITYIRIVFASPRPESFSIYKRVTQTGPWVPYQFYSATCRDTYRLPDSRSIKLGDDESRALCTSEYSEISPLKDGNVAFSSLEGRPSGHKFEDSDVLHNWVTATDIKITLDRLNTFGDEVFGDPQVLRSYFYAISDIAVGARCKCNGHASKCVRSTGINGENNLVCECKHNTDGPDCERCLPLYNNVEWKRATSSEVNECKLCNCNGFADKCYFDRNLYNLTGQGGHCIDCRENRDGPNCERCKMNFYRRDDDRCVPCDCNPTGSRSLQCNSDGKCQCKPGVTGDKCDRCAANHYQFGPHGCQPCNCEVKGSLENTPSCDPETGICLCKDNVEGRRCRECRPGFFNLDLDNRFGCTPCFCYGHTSECQSAFGFSQVSMNSNFNRNSERWQALDLHGRAADLKFNQFSQSIGTVAHGKDNIYFIAPDRFLGDQRASYNKVLKFKLQLVGQVAPDPSVQDIILESGMKKIALPIFAQGNTIPDHNVKEYSFRLHEHHDYNWQPSQSAKSFMSILANLTAIKIRASYAFVGEAILDDVELQSAHRGAGNPATWIEQCTCPAGYLGQYCESCEPGYRHSSKGGPEKPCIPCDCNKHADICDSESGRCICQHNTAGDNCNECAKGFYGNALNGTAHDCKRCPCPNNGACMLIADETVMCLECPNGYSGTKCEQCADGFFGDPIGITGEVRPCATCDCNGNIDPNAVSNCNRTTGECLKCIYNTAGAHCDKCLDGHFGDPLALPHGQCERCSCYPYGTEQTEFGVSQCDQLTGNCNCKPNVIGRDCNECEPGFFNIVSGNGCENCFCDPIGSYNSTCDRFSGQCFCKPGVTGKHCDKCTDFYYGFSSEGCKSCDCDQSGSKSHQCDQNGQCPCNDNVEGRRCDRCKENKHNRHEGCVDCPACYNLVQDAANEHREKLYSLKKTLGDIASAPVTNDDEFESKLKDVKEKVEILLADAKAGAGSGDGTLVERLNTLHEKMDVIQSQLDKADDVQRSADEEMEKATKNFTIATNIIQEIQNELLTAQNLLDDQGQAALDRAREKAKEFGQQSEQISGISKQARLLADKLEAEAEQDVQDAKDASERATKAHDLAMNAVNLNQNNTDELRTDVRLELQQAQINLNRTKKYSDEAFDKAEEAYDISLSIYSNVSSLITPDININQVNLDALNANKNSKALLERVNQTIESNKDIIENLSQEIDLCDLLVKRANEQKNDNIHLLEKAKKAYQKAVDAVEKGDKTFKEASATYNTLVGFSADMQKSEQQAELALETVAGIEKTIRDAESLIRVAEEELKTAQKDALKAKENAQEAENKYAITASMNAETIMDKAKETKTKAESLRGQADLLSERVEVTNSNINESTEKSQKDLNLVENAKDKVGFSKYASEYYSEFNKNLRLEKPVPIQTQLRT
ncbi:LAMC3 family protein [Megaselia abdita]